MKEAWHERMAFSPVFLGKPNIDPEDARAASSFFLPSFFSPVPSLEGPSFPPPQTLGPELRPRPAPAGMSDTIWLGRGPFSQGALPPHPPRNVAANLVSPVGRDCENNDVGAEEKKGKVVQNRVTKDRVVYLKKILTGCYVVFSLGGVENPVFLFLFAFFCLSSVTRRLVDRLSVVCKK